jgi:hypothetical protein
LPNLVFGFVDTIFFHMCEAGLGDGGSRLEKMYHGTMRIDPVAVPLFPRSLKVLWVFCFRSAKVGTQSSRLPVIRPQLTKIQRDMIAINLEHHCRVDRLLFDEILGGSPRLNYSQVDQIDRRQDGHSSQQTPQFSSRSPQTPGCMPAAGDAKCLAGWNVAVAQGDFWFR